MVPPTAEAIAPMPWLDALDVHAQPEPWRSPACLRSASKRTGTWLTQVQTASVSWAGPEAEPQ